MIIITCIKCGDKVEAKSKSKKYCSFCARIVRKKKQIQWKKDNKKRVKEYYQEFKDYQKEFSKDVSYEILNKYIDDRRLEKC